MVRRWMGEIECGISDSSSTRGKVNRLIYLPGHVAPGVKLAGRDGTDAAPSSGDDRNRETPRHRPCSSGKVKVLFSGNLLPSVYSTSRILNVRQAANTQTRHSLATCLRDFLPTFPGNVRGC